MVAPLLAGAAAAAGTALGGVAKGAEVAGKALDRAAGIAETFISASFSMSKAATTGAASLGDMGAAVGQVASLIPVVGAAFASVLNTAIATLEKNIETQKTLSDVGATFGGELKTLRASANSTYLSMDQYAKVVSASGDVLASFNGGVQNGTKNFTNVLTSLLKNGSTTGDMLANLGIGFEEGAQLTAQFMRGLGNMNRTGQMSADQLAKASADYAVELTGLSQLTGQSRKALAEKVNEEMAEAQFQNFLNTLDPTEAAKLQEAVAQEFAVSGKAGADALKASAAGFPPMTQASRLFTATQEASVGRQQELISKIRDSSVDLDTFRVQSKTILANSLEGMREDQKKIATAAMAGVLAGGSELSKSIESITKLLNATYGKGAAEIEGYFKQLRLTAPDAGTDAAIGVRQTKEIIAQSNATLSKLQPFLDSALVAGTKMSSILNGVAGVIAGKLPFITNFVLGKMEILTDKAEKAIGAELTEENAMAAFDKFLNKTGELGKTGIDALFGDKDAQRKFFADLKSGWDSVMKHIKDSIPKLSDFLFGNRPAPGGEGTPSGTPPKPPQTLAEEIADALRKQLGLGAPKISEGAPTELPKPPPGYKYPGMADGGETTPGTYLVGERGPELVSLGNRGDVINNDNLTALISALSNQNGMGESINQLNNTNGQMLAAIKDLIDISKRNLTATRGLNGNLFAA